MKSIDYKEIRKELIRAVRGKVSQERMSRNLGFKANPISHWETDSASVDWNQFIELCKASKRDLPRAFHYILAFSGDPADAGALLSHLTGSRKVSEIARKTGYSRFVVSKWLSGKASPNLDVILKILNELQFILIEFIEAIVPIERIPSLQAVASQLKRQKEATYRDPSIEAILCCLALDSYRTAPKHRPGLISTLLGISLDQELKGLEALKEVGLVSEMGGKYEAKTTQIDTQGKFAESIGIRKYWTRETLDFLERASPPEGRSKSGYFLIDLSAEGERRVQEAFNEFCFKLRAIAQEDGGPKKTVKFCGAQIMDLLELGEYRRVKTVGIEARQKDNRRPGSLGSGARHSFSFKRRSPQATSGRKARSAEKQGAIGR